MLIPVDDEVMDNNTGEAVGAFFEALIGEEHIEEVLKELQPHTAESEHV